MILSDLDIWENAFKEMDLSENVQFVSRGRLITEASQVEMFNKIQALLNSNEMECSHKWLYSLDPSELSESECSKVNNLWNLGIERGFIEDPDAEELAAEGPDTECPVAQEAPAVQAPAAPAPAPTSAFTILYSAMRGGEIKSGESYSNAVSPRAAKADIISQLERAGYSNIKILAIECGDPDDCRKDCSNTYCAQANNMSYQIPDYSIDNNFANEDDEEVEEADDREQLSHAFDYVGVKASTANAAGQNAVKMTLTEDEAKAEVKKAFDAANNAVGDDIEKNKTKKWLNNNKEKLEQIKSKLKSKDAENLDTIVNAIQNFADGKLTEDEEIDEASGKKPKTGLKTLIRGLLKILCTLISLSGSTIGLSGKLLTWAGSLIAVGANKANMMIKDSEELHEADDKEDADSEKADDEEADDADADKENTDSEDSEDADDDKKEDKKEEDAEEPDEKLKDDADDKAEKASDKEKEDKELDASEKSALKDSYKKAFKAAMQKCKFFDKAFDDLTLDEKVKFFTALDTAWKNKADPSKFMTAKETEQLEAIVVKK